MRVGIAGRLAAAFVNSKLTPLVIIASLALGAFAVMKTPREEEPQIIVPMADVLVQMPGATAKDVEQRVTSPMEKLIWEVPGVEYVYSTTSPGMAMTVVRFLVGQNQEAAFVRLREKLQSHFDIIPPGASPPIIKPRSIDDVPILALTLHSRRYDSFHLRQIASRVETAIKQVDDVSETSIIGGRRREVRVTLDRTKLTGFGLTPDGVAMALGASNARSDIGSFSRADAEIAVKTGEFLRSARDVASVVVGAAGGRPIYARDVATVTDGPEEPTNYVLYGAGPAAGSGTEARGAGGVAEGGAGRELEPAVTISVAKRQGRNAIIVAHQALAKIESLKGRIIPSDVTVTETRNYGETAGEKSGELLFHMGIAVLSVTLLIAIALGRKESVVVLVAIPVALALTLLVFYLYGYTLNRITLFALIFSIGILVDDAIVVVENIVRHYRMPIHERQAPLAAAIHAVDEVGNPTILATFAVIAAILPLAFVGGLMGPYMRPIPVGASAAMLFSLVIAFVVTPWAAVRLLRSEHGAEHGGKHKGGEGDDGLTRMYRAIMTPMLRKPAVRWSFFAAVLVMLAGAMALVGMKAVTVKMLPFDNRNEFQIMVDMPTGTSLERTAAATRALADYVATVPEVRNYQLYVGAASPFNFNGLVRHYFMRRSTYQADIQVNLVGKGERKAQSHAIVKRIRPEIARIAEKWGVRVKVAEVPPGPPVLQTLVAEVYGPTDEGRARVAKQVLGIFRSTEGVTDADWYMDDDQTTYGYVVDKEKAAISGVDTASINRTLAMGLAGAQVGLALDPSSREDVPLKVRLPRSQRSGLADLTQLSVASRSGRLTPLTELVTATPIASDKSIYHKNLLPVVYVTGDVTGSQESPVYAILAMNKAIDKLQLPEGYKLNVLTTHVPTTTDKLQMKWDGEWHITYEVFRDLGIAFAAVLVLIYILVVAWFQNFKTPLVIMAPIPLTLIGILPAHAMLGAFFTATSMIGFIAGAGIIVRNSIILVDFIELRLKQGMTLEAAVIDAGATRFRPMLLTAAAVIVGSFVILFDPIFQGLAIALMAGEVASTLLSRLAVPILYFMQRSGERDLHECAPNGRDAQGRPLSDGARDTSEDDDVVTCDMPAPAAP
ncbi:MAG: efflux RND transporter permease subunit [Armatimonadetes bacterium]|nr:efflux RND transporter permease subunit [Armatimonadota bacterium]